MHCASFHLKKEMVSKYLLFHLHSQVIISIFVSVSKRILLVRSTCFVEHFSNIFCSNIFCSNIFVRSFSKSFRRPSHRRTRNRLRASEFGDRRWSSLSSWPRSENSRLRRRTGVGPPEEANPLFSGSRCLR